MPIRPPQVIAWARARVLLIACALLLTAASEDARYAEERKALLAEIQRDAAQTADATGRARFSPRVMGAMDAVPRHRFVPAHSIGSAYANRPLAIDHGHGQTISRPYIVARVYTMEIIAPLAFVMGFPFPLGLSRLAAVAPASIPRVWGINGCASVLSAMLAALLAVHFDYGAVLLMAAGLYVLAVAIWSAPTHTGTF